MRRLPPGLAFGLFTVMALGTCATLRVSSHVEQGIHVTRYRTYDWGPADALPVGDPRLDKDRFFEDRLEGAVEEQMAAPVYGGMS